MVRQGGNGAFLQACNRADRICEVKDLGQLLPIVRSILQDPDQHGGDESVAGAGGVPSP